ETQRQVRRRRSDLPAPAVPLADALHADGDDLLGAFEPLRTRKLDAARIRVHGDFHLGQALWTGQDIVFIDFEGEPGRSAGERAIKRSPLMDVGGMLRSFDYAGRVALATSEERGRAGEAQRPRLEHWREDWTERAQSTFWERYTAAMADSPLLPADLDDARLLLDAHMLIKALYEVRYEIANRPAWVGWPLAAIATLLADRS
ncbi:MAG: phosphotransferase, partial [Actinomycetota bacterium]|nr:phosphotransferase [Actinomycetota bacterium]